LARTSPPPPCVSEGKITAPTATSGQIKRRQRGTRHLINLKKRGEKEGDGRCRGGREKVERVTSWTTGLLGVLKRVGEKKLHRDKRTDRNGS